MNNNRGNQRTVVVTGASSGIGRAIALALDASGFRVFAGVRKQADGNALKQKASPALAPILIDVTDDASIAGAVERVAETTGGELYGLVNNAGVGGGGPLELVPISKTRQLMEVNVIGLLAVTKAFLPLLRRARGRVVNIGSLAGIVAMPGVSSYSASKFAVQAITDSLRLELKPFGVLVTIVDPGAIESAIWKKMKEHKETIFNDASQDLMDLYAPLIEMGNRLIDNPREMLPASCVAGAVLHSLTVHRPKNRYLVGPGPEKAVRLARMPVWLRDWLVGRFINAGTRAKALEQAAAPAAGRGDR